MFNFLFILTISLFLNCNSNLETKPSVVDSIVADSGYAKIVEENVVDTVIQTEQPKEEAIWKTVYENTKASYYTYPYHGRRTANGEIYDHNEMTFARQVKLAKIFPFNCWIKVTNPNNGEQVILRCNDTGGLAKGRTIDISKKAMELLKGIHQGVINVKVEIMVDGDGKIIKDKNIK